MLYHRDMMKKSLIEIKRININLKHIIMISEDGDYLYLNVDYMDGKFLIEKTFKNNHIDLDYMAREMDFFESEERVKDYLKIGERNG